MWLNLNISNMISKAIMTTATTMVLTHINIATNIDDEHLNLIDLIFLIKIS